ncbi:MAG: hypothetical protein H6617_07545 [Bdellovibrionaceae bacterium]|nr:hypothetical protein [Bdellovibrionales bacterium]MCB9254520.1 hypothetical protein [Pseudobdellovibrionaceae bacterium]
MKELKEQFSKLRREAKEAAEDLRGTVEKGYRTSKTVINQARNILGKVADKEKIKTGIQVTSKGASLLAKGARLASKGASTVADGVERASKELEKFGDKIKD